MEAAKAIKLTQENKTNGQNNFPSLINIIEKYKTTKCSNPECKYNKEKYTDAEGLLLYDCFDYHNKSDQRRPVITKASKNKLTNVPLAYSQNVALEILLGHKPNESSQKHCLNGYEYLYHPLNYKSQECQVAKTGKCQTVFCPYYHSPEEQKYFEEYRKIIDQQMNQLPKIEEIQSNISKLKDLVKKPTDENGSTTPTDRSPRSSLTSQINVNQIKTKGTANVDFYVYDDTVKFIEDHYHEFKCLKLHLDTVIKYICGFLNSKGGTLYFGINNDGVVKGTEVKDYEIQNFKKKLYDSLKKFVPPVGEEEVKVNFAPIYKLNKQQQLFLVPNSYIVEFVIKKPPRNDLYFTNYKECFVKRSASINQLRTKEIKYIQLILF